MGFDPPSRLPDYPNRARAACVISLDFDHLTKSLQPGSERWFPRAVPDQLVKNSIGTRDMLALSEKYSIPMTWAMCGRTVNEDPDSYRAILSSKTKQEIGVHTYSHIDVASCSEQELREEIQKCLEILNLSEHPKTFIFPWNRIGHFDTISKMGFVTYRDTKIMVSSPKQKSGLLNLPPTYYVDTKSYGSQGLIKKYLDFCISWNSVFHLWLHPWSVVFDSSDKSGRFAKETIDPVFAYIKQKKDEGVLSVATMGDLATFWLGQHTIERNC